VPIAGIFLGVVACIELFKLWRKPPRLWMRIPDGSGGRFLLWPWNLQRVQFVLGEARAGPTLVIPRRSGALRLRGAAAAEALAVMLPKLNGADCADVSIPDVLRRVERAEVRAARPWKPSRGARRRARERGVTLVAPPSLRPWEQFVRSNLLLWLADASPANRLALEMTVNEEIDRRALEARADALAEEWHDEEEIGEIADSLLIPETVTERLRALRSRSGQRRSASGPTSTTNAGSKPSAGSSG
jgi:hypothetical protein